MMDYQLLFATGVAIILLLLLILKLRIPAFVALLISSICVGLIAEMPAAEILKSMQQGMGSTLGFVAVVVGLGAIFGAILEQSGGAEKLADYLLKKMGLNNAPYALMLTGFFVAIPVFFDVAFIILIPLVYAIQKRTGKSLLLYALPLLAGLAITHAFVPPTPGPVAVADIVKADLGMVIIFGFITGLPCAFLAGPIFAKYISNKIHVEAPQFVLSENNGGNKDISVGSIFSIIAVPIILIVLNTLLNGAHLPGIKISGGLSQFLELIGHPFTALIIANLLAWYYLGVRRNISSDKLLYMSNQSLNTAGIIILLTGAGGVFKQLLIDTGTGEMIAQLMSEAGFSILIFGFLSAAAVRILQGSATVSMITAAGLSAPLLGSTVTEPLKALLVISIAAGATILSHVNDSGFWLVSKYLGISEKETFRSWSVMTTIISLTGLVMVLLISMFI